MEYHITYILLLSCVITTVTAQSAAPIIQTTYGKVQGIQTSVHSTTLTKFLGIPFAMPPVGDKRFQKPMKPNPWTDTKNTTVFGPSCYQSIISATPGAPKVPESEDCLYLNVFIPGSLSTTGKTVMVFIYGGGWIEGNSNTYPGDTLAVLQNVIVVTFNYRLGLFGFMSSPDGIFPANVGLFDQHAALVWVKENIAVFGGDASKVTIFGESAGADSVLNHFVSPLSKDLFSRAIIESPPYLGLTPKPEAQYSMVKENIGDVCGKVDSSQELLDCLTKVKAEDLVSLGDYLMGMNYRHVVVDGEFLPQNAIKLLVSGQFNKEKEVIIGYMSGDGNDVISSIVPDSPFKEFVSRGINLKDAKLMTMGFLDYYFYGRTQSNMPIMQNLLYQKYLSCQHGPISLAQGILDMATDAGYSAIAYKIASVISMYGGKAYLYQFSHATNYKKEEGSMLNVAAHGDDILYIFGFIIDLKNYLPILKAEDHLARSFMTAFATFAKTGQPVFLTNSNKTVQWKQFTNLKKEYIDFNANMTMNSTGPIPESLLKRFDMWLSVLPNIQNMKTCDPYVPNVPPRPPTSKGLPVSSMPLFELLGLAVVTVMMSSKIYGWN